MRGAAKEGRKEGRRRHDETQRKETERHGTRAKGELLLCDSSKMDSMTVTMAGHKALNGSRTAEPCPFCSLPSSHPMETLKPVCMKNARVEN